MKDWHEMAITTSLRAQASQENCDGEPYNTMIRAADAIEQLTETIVYWMEENKQRNIDNEALREAITSIHDRLSIVYPYRDDGAEGDSINSSFEIAKQALQGGKDA